MTCFSQIHLGSMISIGNLRLLKHASVVGESTKKEINIRLSKSKG